MGSRKEKRESAAWSYQGPEPWFEIVDSIEKQEGHVEALRLGDGVDVDAAAHHREVEKQGWQRDLKKEH